MCGFEGGRIVHAIAGHGDNFAVRFKGFHQAQFLLRDDARKYLNARQPGAQGFIGQCIQLSSGQYLFGCQAQFAGDGQCGSGMVAGDHHHPDAGGVALCDRVLYIGAKWVL